VEARGQGRQDLGHVPGNRQSFSGRRPAATTTNGIPRRAAQYIINLDGGVSIQASDGETRITSARARCLLVEDTSGKGHFSRLSRARCAIPIFVPIEVGPAMASALMIVDVQQGMFSLPSPLQPRRRKKSCGASPACSIAPAPEGECLSSISSTMAGPRPCPAKGLTGLAASSDGGRRAPTRWWSRKRHSSAFHDTDLASAALAMPALIGWSSSPACRPRCASISACLRALVALGLVRVALVADAHTTYDTPMLRADLIIAHTNRLLGRVFVDLVEARQVRFSGVAMTVQTVLDPTNDLVEQAKRVLPGGSFGNMPAEVVLKEGKGGRILGRGGPRICRLSPGLRPDVRGPRPFPT